MTIQRILLAGALAMIPNACINIGEKDGDPRWLAQLHSLGGISILIEGEIHDLSADEVTAAVDARVDQWVAWRVTPAGGSYAESALRDRARACLIRVRDDSCFITISSPTKWANGETKDKNKDHPDVTVCWYACLREDRDGAPAVPPPPWTLHEGGRYGVAVMPGCPAIMHELDHCIGVGHSPDPLAHW